MFKSSFNFYRASLVFLILALLVVSVNSAFCSQVILNAKSSQLQINQAEEAYNAGDVNAAHAIISRLRPILSESTELHAQLYEALKGEASAKLTAEEEKKQTIEFAKLRDKANYLAGLISIKQGNYREAAKHLVQVVESQRTTKLGEDAYNSLRKIGFSPKLNLKDQI
ncbi:MAG: hypothetical protein QNJ31_07525 [Candidatus Caenarcaniphilales bacterium]|nr:hypothetical protein [Candidatus Caenarcaniphilales bacterium]